MYRPASKPDPCRKYKDSPGTLCKTRPDTRHPAPDTRYPTQVVMMDTLTHTQIGVTEAADVGLLGGRGSLDE